jgi:cellulase/cellobiase CelA1
MRTVNRVRGTLLSLVCAAAGCGVEPSAPSGPIERTTSSLTTQPLANPRWNVLVLVYLKTDFTYSDANGVSRHVVATMTHDEVKRVEPAARLFFGSDVSYLTNGNMQADVTVRYPSTLASLSTIGEEFWPSYDDTAAEHDPRYDSIVVVWDATGTDQKTGEAVSLTKDYGGVAAPMGTRQTYATIPTDNISVENRNVFKHEWGHSILFYHDAAGIAPTPPADNHINATDKQYVNCLNQQPYILVDETPSNPIPRSIYNNYVGFTHDYYSGQTATADQPRRCLGITPQAWLAGGPVTKPNPNGGLTAAITITSEWTTGYCGEIVVSNTSAQPLDWAVRVTVSGQVYTLWNANYQQTDNQLELAGQDWNRSLAPGQRTQSIGFCANR